MKFIKIGHSQDAYYIKVYYYLRDCTLCLQFPFPREVWNTEYGDCFQYFYFSVLLLHYIVELHVSADHARGDYQCSDVKEEAFLFIVMKCLLRALVNIVNQVVSLFS